ncbi:MAG: C69 family dipeptidase, partial [Candidatus Aminicenantales bacterium]
YAAANGWYDEAKDGLFDFKKAYTLPVKDLIFDANVLRHWRGLSLMTGREWPIADDYPFAVKPAEKVTVEKLKTVLRDHYEGTPYDATDGYKTGTPNQTKYRTICTMTTVVSLIASLNVARPEPLSVSLWLTLGKPDTTIFMPFYYAGENLPEGLGLGPRTHDDAVFSRQHFEVDEFKAARGSLLAARILDLEKLVNEKNYGERIAPLRKEMDPAERELFDRRKKFEAEFEALYARDGKTALKMLDDYVAAAVDRVSQLTRKLLNGAVK